MLFPLFLGHEKNFIGAVVHNSQLLLLFFLSFLYNQFFPYTASKKKNNNQQPNKSKSIIGRNAHAMFPLSLSILSSLMENDHKIRKHYVSNLKLFSDINDDSSVGLSSIWRQESGKSNLKGVWVFCSV